MTQSEVYAFLKKYPNELFTPEEVSRALNCEQRRVALKLRKLHEFGFVDKKIYGNLRLYGVRK